MGLQDNRSPTGDAAAQAAGDAQYRETSRTRNERISLLADQLGAEDMTRVRRFGTRSLLAGTGGGVAAPLAGLAKGGGGGKGAGSAFGLVPGLFSSLFGR